MTTPKAADDEPAPTKTPTEEWAEFGDRLRGLLSRSLAEAQIIYPQRLSPDEAAKEGRALKALLRAGEEFMSDLRKFYGRANGKPATTPSKETKK